MQIFIEPNWCDVYFGKQIETKIASEIHRFLPDVDCKESNTRADIGHSPFWIMEAFLDDE